MIAAISHITPVVSIVPGLSGSKVIIHGDSITAGAGASRPEYAYTTRYQQLTGLQVWPMAQYSRTVQEGLQPWNLENSLEHVVFNPNASQQQYNPVFAFDPEYKYIMFRLGINDCLQKDFALPGYVIFKQKYKACISRFIELGWPLERIKIINIGHYLGSDTRVLQAISDYNNVIDEMGTELEIQVLDLYNFDNNQTVNDLYEDDVHPSDFGHEQHAAFIASILT